MREAVRIVIAFEKWTFSLYIQGLNKELRSDFIKNQKYTYMT